jgi:hypothetical protein
VEAQVSLSERQIAAGLLILSCLVFAVGGILFTGRAFLKWPAAQTSGYLIWERGFVIASVLVNVLGLVLLADILRAAGDPVVGRLGMIAYGFGAAIVVVAETSYLSKQEWLYAQIGQTSASSSKTCTTSSVSIPAWATYLSWLLCSSVAFKSRLQVRIA